jgi:hypothetical protein
MSTKQDGLTSEDSNICSRDPENLRTINLPSVTEAYNATSPKKKLSLRDNHRDKSLSNNICTLLNIFFST